MRRASLNHTYRLVFDLLKQLWIPVAETARRRGKSGSTVLLSAGVLAFASGAASALPTGGVVSAGAGDISQSGSAMTVSQQSQSLALNWQSFGIGANESVTFVQPGRSAIALNRVLGQDASQILGRLNANGQVFILNPNGVFFGAGANVSVGGLLASTRQLSDSDFTSGNFVLSGNSAAAVRNAGAITAAEGGYVALLGSTVENTGSISAAKGNVSLAGGEQLTLQLDNGTLVGLTVDKGAVDALAANHGVVSANGGQILLTAQAADEITRAVVNNTGLLEAQTVDNQNGVVRLLGDMQTGMVNVAGTLDASAPDGGNGGFVETSAATVTVADGTRVTTLAAQGESGEWLIDPADYTIAASGGNISGATLSSNLGGGNVTILSSSGTAGGNGDIHVNDAVSWSANTLTLTAARDVNINAVMTAGGSAGLALNTGTANGADSAVAGGAVNAGMGGGGFVGRVDFTGAGNTVSINGNAYTIIRTLGAQGSTTGTDLQGMSSGRYVLGADIDASATSSWNSGAGFAPLSGGTAFDGLGHIVSNLTINRPTVDGVGLFGSGPSSLRNVGLTNVNISGDFHVGGLAGSGGTTISHAFTTGSVTGSYYVGGLVGSGGGGTISTVYSTANVAGVTHDPMYGSGYVGGLIGSQGVSSILAIAYASGNVSGQNYVGGLIGSSGTYATTSNVYATGSVAGQTSVGGLIGAASSGTVDHAYATGLVTGYTGGGLIGASGGPVTVSNSYWDKQTTGKTVSYEYNMATGQGTTTGTGAVGLTTTQMKQASSYAGWSIDNVGGAATTWRIYDGNTYALLKAFLTPLTATANGSATYNGTSSFTLNSGNFQYSSNALPGQVLVKSATLTTPGKNVGSYSLGALGYSSNFYSTQQGHDLAVTLGSFTITPAAVTVSTGNVTKTYDATTSAAGSLVVTAGTLFGSDSLSGGSFAFANADAGTNKTVNVSGVTVSDGNGGANYSVTQAANTASTINKATLTYAANMAARSYGAANPAFSGAVTGFVGGETQGTATTGTLAFNTTATTASNVGSYAINGSGLAATNYSFVQAAGNTTALTINPAALVLNAVTDTKVYDGGASSDEIVSVTGLVNGNTVTGLTQGYASKNVLGAGGSTLQVNGGYVVNDGNSGLNYSVVTNTATGSITPAAVTVSTSNVTKTYDASTSAAGTAVVIGGMLYGSDVLSGGSFAFTNANAGSGNKTVTVGGVTVSDGNSGANYAVTHASNTTSTINKATLTLNAVTDTKVYDTTTASSVAVSVLGLQGSDDVLGETQSFVSKDVLGAGGSTLQVNAGYTVNDGNGGNNYSVVANTAAGMIDKAALTVTAIDASREASAADPVFTASFDGFVADENIGALAGSLVFNTDVTAASAAGTYAITPAGLSSNNYAIAFVDGTFTITGVIGTGTGNDGVHGAQGNAWAYGHDNGNNGDNDGSKHCNNGGDVNSCNNGDRGNNIFISNGGDVPGSNGSLMRVEEDGLRLPKGV